MAAGGEYGLRDLADDLTARVGVAVDSVAEAKEEFLLGLDGGYEGWDVLHLADLLNHADDGLVRTAM